MGDESRKRDFRAAQIIEGGMQTQDPLPVARGSKSSESNNVPRVWVDAGGEASAEDVRNFRAVLWKDVLKHIVELSNSKEWALTKPETIKQLTQLHDECVTQWERSRVFTLAPQVLAAEQQCLIDFVEPIVASNARDNGVEVSDEYRRKSMEEKCAYFRRHDALYVPWALMIAAAISSNANISQYRVANNRMLYRTNLQVQNTEKHYLRAVARFKMCFVDFIRGSERFPTKEELGTAYLWSLSEVKNAHSRPDADDTTRPSALTRLKRSADEEYLDVLRPPLRPRAGHE